MTSQCGLSSYREGENWVGEEVVRGGYEVGVMIREKSRLFSPLYFDSSQYYMLLYSIYTLISSLGDHNRLE